MFITIIQRGILQQVLLCEANSFWIVHEGRKRETPCLRVWYVVHYRNICELYYHLIAPLTRILIMLFLNHLLCSYACHFYTFMYWYQYNFYMHLESLVDKHNFLNPPMNTTRYRENISDDESNWRYLLKVNRCY